MLSQNAEAEAKFHAEIDELLANDRLPNFEDYPKLKYTEAVFAESMRLFPPAWIVGRTAIAAHLDDKFSGIDYTDGIEGVPVLADCLVNLECRLKNSFDGGDHTIFVGEIEKATIRDDKPLLYFHGKYNELRY